MNCGVLVEGCCGAPLVQEGLPRGEKVHQGGENVRFQHGPESSLDFGNGDEIGAVENRRHACNGDEEGRMAERLGN